MLSCHLRDDGVISINRGTCFKRISTLLLFFIRTISKKSNSLYCNNKSFESCLKSWIYTLTLAVPKFIIGN